MEETYGITVYQEQVMLLSQSLAGFTKGEADTLRKAMGKKKLDLLAKLKPKFLDQGNERGHDRDKLDKIWRDWELLHPTPSINLTLPVMLGWPTKRLI